MQIGSRMCALISIDKTISTFGFGTYDGIEVPDSYNVRSHSVCYKQLGIPLNYITLDSGKKVYECECFFVNENEVIETGLKLFSTEIYKTIDINDYRNGNLIALARSTATNAHHNQKYGFHPYVKHCYHVVSIIRKFNFNLPEAEAVGFLHDVIEDCDQSYHNLILRCFGKDIYDNIIRVTNVGENRKEKLENLITNAKYQYIPTIVKCADRIANITACINDNKTKLLNTYLSEHTEFMKLNCFDDFELETMFKYLEKIVSNAQNGF